MVVVAESHRGRRQATNRSAANSTAQEDSAVMPLLRVDRLARGRRGGHLHGAWDTASSHRCRLQEDERELNPLRGSTIGARFAERKRALSPSPPAALSASFIGPPARRRSGGGG
ncbi:hypothetical protein [Oryza sativa Japonica Group]|uniref:Uncharacterized protein n=1 Tax=Oryza sativa subsp. japonica TaxID=39947 RepID=Q5SNI0_ORYSJ|nr:hypothetical protein [Oryza sativa Japonica Group]